MTKIFIFLVFFFTFLFGAYENELAEFDKQFIYSKAQEQVKFHHQLKIFYIQSVINEDEKTKIEVLKRLIISSRFLKLDDQSYVNELKESGVNQASIDALRRVFVKDIKIEDNVKNVEKTVFKSSEKNENIKSVKIKRVQENDLLQNNDEKIYVLRSNKVQEGVEFELSANLDKNDIKSFVLNEPGNYRFISDFTGVLEETKKEFKFNDYRLVISQFDPKTIRIVVYAKKELLINISFKEKKLIFSKQSLESKNTKEENKTTKQKISKINNEILSVLNTEKMSNSIALNLNANLGEKEINVSNFKDQKNFRYIVSFKAILKGSRKNFVFGENTISIVQYDPKTVRVVLSSPKEFKLLKNLKDKNLILGFNTQTNNKKISQNSNKTLSVNYKGQKLIVIDAGHGGKDSGALNDKKGILKEKDIVLNVALKLGLELQKRGYKILYTRHLDKFINLRDRTKYANDKNADLFISIHANAAPNAAKVRSSEGVETFFLSPARSERSKKVAEKENQGDFEEINYFSKQSILNFLNREKIVASNKLAIDVQKNILIQTRKKYRIVDGGVREAPFWVLVGAQMPAILIEIGYITHPTEGKRLTNKTFQDLLVKGIADGVENYFYYNP
ncbi:N-acetylmuramoyl-L-alanine amidase [Campylobacter hepaticus]|uniref:N-acetylmuramoyl-L-alanine amidase n=1 Tax=Campylobacter hepaticus TaxID=1813019 RepID=A0A6A7JR20_9BACT|nr:N-acetylmuramoyl-L-alanine amidase [Campylobacter hepaticus]AXP08267.1 N-acetylmuramoyl-L-alanine amidase [Campylobacter hepaticus]MPV53506.1 AMIN domain-containing protein [Campylobacter hepaticus]MPV62023.1 AMIN domain-containing protein [Campylobacter hepaticus]MPV76817.1 AMIN domain-containing protein [Campylobacter hepaticus]MPV78163.1 AMIN domain-containing protein [Campylobacter hepaticus]